MRSIGLMDWDDSWLKDIAKVVLTERPGQARRAAADESARSRSTGTSDGRPVDEVSSRARTARRMRSTARAIARGVIWSRSAMIRRASGRWSSWLRRYGRREDDQLAAADNPSILDSQAILVHRQSLSNGRDGQEQGDEQALRPQARKGGGDSRRDTTALVLAETSSLAQASPGCRLPLVTATLPAALTMSDTLPPLELFIASVLAGLSLEAVAEDEAQLSYIAALVGEEVGR